MQKDLLIFLLIGIVFFLVDVTTFEYNNKSVYPILLLHHVINIFAQFGFLASDKRLLLLYVFAPIVTIAHWKTNNNQCVLTETVNRNCNLPPDTKFRDIWYLLGVKNLKNYDALHYGYLIVAWVIAILRFRFTFNKSPLISPLESVQADDRSSD